MGRYDHFKFKSFIISFNILFSHLKNSSFESILNLSNSSEPKNLSDPIHTTVAYSQKAQFPYTYIISIRPRN